VLTCLSIIKSRLPAFFDYFNKAIVVVPANHQNNPRPSAWLCKHRDALFFLRILARPIISWRRISVRRIFEMIGPIGNSKEKVTIR